MKTKRPTSSNASQALLQDISVSSNTCSSNAFTNDRTDSSSSDSKFFSNLIKETSKLKTFIQSGLKSKIAFEIL